MNYTIGEISKKLNLSPSTLRYYDKEGLLPLVRRTDGGIRIFDDNDVTWLNMIECLKNTGMPLKDIKVFFEWCQEGDTTIEKRLEMFLERKKETERQISVLKKSLDLIDYKCEYYRKAAAAGTTDFAKSGASCQTCSKDSHGQNRLLQDAAATDKYNLK